MLWILLILSITGSTNSIEIPELSKKPICTLNSSIMDEGAMIKDFIEISPTDSATPEVETEVYVGKLVNTLYIMFLCNEKSKIRYTLLKRDEYRVDNDVVTVLIDPDNSGARSFGFSMNPAGSLSDYLETSGNVNFSYDFNWTGTAVVYDSLWVALFEIPLSVFSNIKEENFRIMFLRFRPSDNLYQYAWPPVPLSSNADPYGTFLLKETRIKKISPGVIPYILVSSGPPVRPENSTVRAGFTGRVSHTSGGNLLLAVKPDFSTVETDEPQITVNNPYALYLREKRPIFLESGDVFERKSYMIYTRRLNEPSGVIKVAGKFRDTELGFLSAYDVSNSLLYTTNYGSFEIPSGDSALANIITLRHYFDKGTFLGIVLNSRNSTSGIANYAGFIEGVLNYRNLLYFSGIFGYSERGSGTLDRKGELVDATVSLKIRNFSPFFSWYSVSKDFSNQNGFLRSADVSSLTPGFSLRLPMSWALIKFGQVDFSYSLNSDYERSYRNDSLSLSVMASLKYRTDMYLAYMRFSKDILGSSLKNLNLVSFTLSMYPADFSRVGATFGTGRTINYFTFPVDEGDFNSIALYGDFAFGKKALTSLEYRSYSLKGENRVIASQSTYFLKVLYNLTNQLSCRWITSYDGDQIGVHPVLSYQVSPYTLFYIGGSVQGPRDGRLAKWEKNIFLKAQISFGVL